MNTRQPERRDRRLRHPEKDLSHTEKEVKAWALCRRRAQRRVSQGVSL